MSPSPAAPSSASISACASTSPSEWPARPRGWSKRDAAEHERHALLERVRVDADADAEVSHGEHLGQLVERLGSRIASAGGSCRWPHGPRRMCTAAMPAASAGRDVVVDAVADVGDLAGRHRRARRRRARRTPAPASRRPSAPTSATQSTCGRRSSSTNAGVLPRRADAVARRAQLARGTAARRGTKSSSTHVAGGDARRRAAPRRVVRLAARAIAPPSDAPSA